MVFILRHKEGYILTIQNCNYAIFYVDFKHNFGSKTRLVTNVQVDYHTRLKVFKIYYS